MVSPASLTISDLRPGDHACFLYDTEAEHRAVLTEYVREGLRRGEKVVYFVDTHTSALLIDYLQDELNIGRYLKIGQLQTLQAEKVYLSSGAFDTGRMLRVLAAEVERALKEGYAALRATGEMTWALRGAPGSEQLATYESRINNFSPDHPFIGLCQYDRRVFPSELLLDNLLAHPLVATGPSLARNRHHTPSSEPRPVDIDALLKSLSLSTRTS